MVYPFGKKFEMENLFMCRHFDTSSHLELRRRDLSAVIIFNFSVLQRLHSLGEVAVSSNSITNRPL